MQGYAIQVFNTVKWDNKYGGEGVNWDAHPTFHRNVVAAKLIKILQNLKWWH
jgi:hypothetical protein